MSASYSAHTSDLSFVGGADYKLLCLFEGWHSYPQNRRTPFPSHALESFSWLISCPKHSWPKMGVSWFSVFPSFLFLYLKYLYWSHPSSLCWHVRKPGRSENQLNHIFSRSHGARPGNAMAKFFFLLWCLALDDEDWQVRSVVTLYDTASFEIFWAHQHSSSTVWMGFEPMTGERTLWRGHLPVCNSWHQNEMELNETAC